MINTILSIEYVPELKKVSPEKEESIPFLLWHKEELFCRP
jgi:hypothetical protein